MSNWESYQGCLIRTRFVAENYYDYKCNAQLHTTVLQQLWTRLKKAFDLRGCVKYFIAEDVANRLPGGNQWDCVPLWVNGQHIWTYVQWKLVITATTFVG